MVWFGIKYFRKDAFRSIDSVGRKKKPFYSEVTFMVIVVKTAFRKCHYLVILQSLCVFRWVIASNPRIILHASEVSVVKVGQGRFICAYEVHVSFSILRS